MMMMMMILVHTTGTLRLVYYRTLATLYCFYLYTIHSTHRIESITPYTPNTAQQEGFHTAVRVAKDSCDFPLRSSIIIVNDSAHIIFEYRSVLIASEYDTWSVQRQNRILDACFPYTVCPCRSDLTGPAANGEGHTRSTPNNKTNIKRTTSEKKHQPRDSTNQHFFVVTIYRYTDIHIVKKYESSLLFVLESY